MRHPRKYGSGCPTSAGAIPQGLGMIPAEWLAILLIIVADAILLSLTSFRLQAAPVLYSLPALILLTGAQQIYSRWRPEPRLTHLAHTGLVLILFTASVEILNYILTGMLPLPRWDAGLAAADHALGLHWLDWYHWVLLHPPLHALFHAVYGSLGPEMLALFIALELSGKHQMARAFRQWFILSALITIFIGIMMPAEGAFAYYHLAVAQRTAYVWQMADLRNGTLRTINLFDGQGLVVFPSFHATLALLCALAARPWKELRIFLYLLNVLIILSAPTEGGHYFIDIIAGIAVAAMTLAVIPRAVAV